MTSETAASETAFTNYADLPWVKAWNAVPAHGLVGGWNAALSILADRLQDQAGFVRQLSQCSDPAEALQLNATFTQQSVKHLWDDSVAILEGWYSNLGTAPSAR